MSVLTFLALITLGSILTALHTRSVTKAFLAGIEASQSMLPKARSPVHMRGYTPSPPFTLDQIDVLLSSDHPPNVARATTPAEILEAAKKNGGAAGYIKRGGGWVQ